MTVAATSDTSSNSILQSYLATQAQNIAADKTAAAAASTSTSSALASTNSATSIGSNFNTFINILTTQLQNQDPTNATDPNQFTQELVQFAGVEQQLNTNNDLQTLITLQKNSSGVNADLNYMGQYVESTATTGSGGGALLQGGSSQFGYTLPSTSSTSSVAVTVKDMSGNTVAILSGPTSSGTNYISWNGQTANGTQEPDGTYTFTVAATDSAGNAVTPTDFRTIGKVTGVNSNTDGSTNLLLGSNNASVATSTIDAVYGTSTSGLPTATTETPTS